MSFGENIFVIVILLLFSCRILSYGDVTENIIENGRSNSEIIISRQAPRMTRLAAEELQKYLQKISGVKVPISSYLNSHYAVKIYVGQSKYTDALSFGFDELHGGGFKIISGKSWLALIGEDEDYIPREGFVTSRYRKKQMTKDWEANTGKKWENPLSTIFKAYNGKLGIWEFDKKGSFNATCEFLRLLGVRWFLPGEFGEIVPQMNTIELPQIDQVFNPDFDYREFYFYGKRYYTASMDEIMWQLHLGLNSEPGLIGHCENKGHGITNIHSRLEGKTDETWFALYAGKRAIYTGKDKKGHPCLSSENLFQENINFAESFFETYREPIISVMPADGYIRLCQCEFCKGKDSPERGNEGKLSDYVWGYVDRVARRLIKSYPDKKVLCFAYGTYLLPPTNIDKLSPNIIVGICRWRSNLVDSSKRNFYTNLIKEWEQKVSNKIVIWDYYLHGRPGNKTETLPVLFPQIISEDLKFLKGRSVGEYIEVFRGAESSDHIDLSTNHLNVYITSRLYWNVNQNVDSLLTDYCQKFYGPAAEQMKLFFTISENKWQQIPEDSKVIKHLFSMLEKAKVLAGDENNIYFKRIDWIYHSMLPLKHVQQRLLQERNPSLNAKILKAKNIELTVDGDLKEGIWKSRVYRLKGTTKNSLETVFSIFQMNKSLYFGIKCNLNSNKSQSDQTTYDNVELLLETPSSRIEKYNISRKEVLEMVDAKYPGVQIATHEGNGFWSVEMKISLGSEILPSELYPWFFNIGRRINSNSGAKSFSAFTSTNEADFYKKDNFASFY